MKKRFGFSFLIVIMLACAGWTWAEKDDARGSAASGVESVEAEAPSQGTKGAEESSTMLPVYGMQMWIDEDTGLFRAPTAEEAASFSRQLQQMFSKVKVEPEMRIHKSGMLSAALHESMMEFSVVRIGEDGQLIRDCVDEAHQALEFIEQSGHDSGREEE